MRYVWALGSQHVCVLIGVSQAIEAPIKEAIEQSGLPLEDIHEVLSGLG